MLFIQPFVVKQFIQPFVVSLSNHMCPATNALRLAQGERLA